MTCGLQLHQEPQDTNPFTLAWIRNEDQSATRVVLDDLLPPFPPHEDCDPLFQNLHHPNRLPSSCRITGQDSRRRNSLYVSLPGAQTSFTSISLITPRKRRSTLIRSIIATQSISTSVISGASHVWSDIKPRLEPRRRQSRLRYFPSAKTDFQLQSRER